MQAHKRHTGERFDAVWAALSRRQHSARLRNTFAFEVQLRHAKNAREHVWCYSTEPGRSFHKQAYREAVGHLRDINRY